MIVRGSLPHWFCCRRPVQGPAAGVRPVAAQAGLQAGDVILMVNQQRVGNVAEFQAATKEVRLGNTVLLLVRRGDQSNFIGLTIPDDK